MSLLGMGFYSKLLPHHITKADGVGNDRQDAAELKGRVTNVPRARQRGGNIHAARCECALWVFYPMLRWNDLAEKIHGLPDLEQDGMWLKLDGKGVRYHRHQLIVPYLEKRANKGVVPHWAYMKVSSQEHPYYWIAGWVWGAEVSRAPIKCLDPDRPDAPTYVVEQRLLRSPMLLPVW